MNPRPVWSWIAVPMIGVLICAGCGSTPAQTPPVLAPAADVAGRPPAEGIRLSGTIEAIHARSVIVPRLAGQVTPTLVITSLVKSGTLVKPGDLVLQLDPQDQVRAAMDKRAEVADLEDQIQKKRADQAVAGAADQTAITVAEHDLRRAQLDQLNNDLVAKVQAEKNDLAYEQAKAKLDLLRSTAALKQKANDADVKMLEIQRERSLRALQYAEKNVTLMAVRATFAGIAVLKTTYKGSSQVEVSAGDEVRPGSPVMDIIDPQAMQVRAKVNQADIGLIAPGQSATVRLDAYPELKFSGHVELIAPLGIPSNYSATVRTFVVLVPINGTHPRLMPDLTASVDVAPAKAAGGRP